MPFFDWEYGRLFFPFFAGPTIVEIDKVFSSLKEVQGPPFFLSRGIGVFLPFPPRRVALADKESVQDVPGLSPCLP